MKPMDKEMTHRTDQIRSNGNYQTGSQIGKGPSQAKVAESQTATRQDIPEEEKTG